MDEEQNPDIIAESVKTLIAGLEQNGVDPGEITLTLLNLVSERCKAQDPITEVETSVYDNEEIMLMSIGARLAAKRKGNVNNPALALLAYASEKCLALLGREKLRDHFQFLSTELTCPSDFWGKG